MQANELRRRLFRSATVAGLAVGLLTMVTGCDTAETQASAPPPPPVNVIVPVASVVQEYDNFSGRVAAVSSIDVRSRVPGYVTSISFKDGDFVKKDQILFQIDAKPYEAAISAAKAQRKQAQAEADYGNRELERLKPLQASGAASPLEMSKAQDQADRGAASVAKADAEIEAKQLDLDYATVKSPIDGRVSRSNFSIGNLIAGDTPLTNVVSLDPVYVNMDVDDNTLLFYRREARKKAESQDITRIRDANLPMFVAMTDEKDFPHKGIMEYIDNQVDPMTGTIRVRGEFPNPQRILTPGQFVRARFPRGDARERLLVPDRAIGRDQDRKYVLAVNDKNIVEYKAVETGELFGENRAIISGLNAGERVVVDGVQRARPGQPVTPTLVQPATQPTSQPAISAK
ncbi:MAG: efflux RND transporter periplasmic adaptor subunit [Anaerolineae bacterium]|nr:efflux RND transporter periplasmic adaptor subunit [Phycisphaerae bacterium]